MARVIRAGHLMGGPGDFTSPFFHKLPDICTSVATKYGAALPDRVKRFACQISGHQPGIVRNPTKVIARHALRHDTESVYWVLVWWAICAAPEGRASSPVRPTLWNILTSSDCDDRPTMIKDSDLDPSYNALKSLLNNLASYLEHDLHWATEAPFNDPEFLHEALQRRILNFLIENEDEDFLLLPTSGKPREPEKLISYAEPPQSRIEHLRSFSTVGISNSLKRPASGQDESKVSPMILRPTAKNINGCFQRKFKRAT